jgi:hypothetical protein
MGIMVPETCWATSKFCNKNQSVACSWPFYFHVLTTMQVKLTSSVQYTIVNNTYLATCFISNEQYSGQYLIYGHGAFSGCVQYGIPYCLQPFFIKKNSSYKIHWPMYWADTMKQTLLLPEFPCCILTPYFGNLYYTSTDTLQPTQVHVTATSDFKHFKK